MPCDDPVHVFRTGSAMCECGARMNAPIPTRLWPYVSQIVRDAELPDGAEPETSLEELIAHLDDLIAYVKDSGYTRLACRLDDVAAAARGDMELYGEKAPRENDADQNGSRVGVGARRGL